VSEQSPVVSCSHCVTRRYTATHELLDYDNEVCMCVCVCVCVCVRERERYCVLTSPFIYCPVHICVYVCVYVCVCMNVLVRH
jgi:hypothetical protein